MAAGVAPASPDAPLVEPFRSYGFRFYSVHGSLLCWRGGGGLNSVRADSLR